MGNPARRGVSHLLGAEDNLERRARPWGGAQRQCTADRGSALTHVFQALAGATVFDFEAAAVVADRDEPLARALPDLNPGMLGAGMLACVREAFLHDPEELALIVRAELDGRVDRQRGLDRTVGGHGMELSAH